MTAADANIAADLFAYLAQLSPMEAAGFLIVLALCIRLVRGSSIKELLGLRNDIVRGNEFRAAVKEINGRLDRHFHITEGLREDVGEISEKVAKLDGQLEQYRNK